MSTLCKRLIANEKRKASCKAVGSKKKQLGHAHEHEFAKRWGGENNTHTLTYKAEADNEIRDLRLLEKLRTTLGDIPNGNTSLKSGLNIQFTLGRIPEIMNTENKTIALKQRVVWEKYLAKSESANPAVILCYRDDGKWLFFRMKDVIDFIVEKSKWRLLDSGRLKGDFDDDSKKGISQYLTCEYRKTHNSYLLAANGYKGQRFMYLLKNNIPCHVEND